MEHYSLGMGPRHFHGQKADQVFPESLFPFLDSCMMLGEGDEDLSDDRMKGGKILPVKQLTGRMS